MKATTFSLTLLLVFCLAKTHQLLGQDSVEMDLQAEIAVQDKILFDAFNIGDVETLKGMFTTDLEFYHDKVGLSNYESNMNAIDNLTTGEIKVRRELVEGSMKVFPVPGFGAIQEGRHDFFETLTGQAERKTGTFKFLHIWKKTDDSWKVARVISYDH